MERMTAASFGQRPPMMSKACRIPEDLGRIDAGHGHDADVLGIGRGRRAAEEAGDHGRDAVTGKGARKHRTVVLADNLADSKKVADVLDHDDEGNRADERHGTPVPGRMMEGRKADPGCVDDRLEIDHAEHEGDKVADDDCEKDWNRADEAAHRREDDGSEERDGGNECALLEEDGRAICCGRLECHLRGCGGQADADDDHDGSDEDRRKQAVEPAGADKLDDASDEQEDAACNDYAGEGCIEAPALRR